MILKMIISRTRVIWALFWENRISSKLAVISTSSEEGRTSYSIKEIRTNFMQIMGKYWENIRGEQRSQYQSWLIFCVNLRTGTQIFLHLKKTTNRHSYKAISPYWSLLNNIHNIHKSRTMHLSNHTSHPPKFNFGHIAVQLGRAMWARLALHLSCFSNPSTYFLCRKTKKACADLEKE